MKRTLSLILALAMIMSLFTTVSFATEEEKTPTKASASISSISYKEGDEESPVEYPVEHKSGLNKVIVYYVGSAPDLSEGEFTLKLKNNKTVAEGTLVYDSANTGKELTFDITDDDEKTYYIKVETKELSFDVQAAASSSTVKIAADKDAKEVYLLGEEPAAKHVTATVEDDGSLNLKAKVADVGEGQTAIKAKVVKSGSGNSTVYYFGGAECATGFTFVKDTLLAKEVTVDVNANLSDKGKLNYYPGTIKLQLPTKLKTDLDDEFYSAADDGGKVSYNAEKMDIEADSDATAEDAAVLTFTCYGGKEGTEDRKQFTIIQPVKIHVLSADLTVGINNGSSKEYTSTSTINPLRDAIIEAIKAEYDLSSLNLKTLTLDIPEAENGFKFYNKKSGDDKVELDDEDTVVLLGGGDGDIKSLYVTTTAEELGECKVTYVATSGTGENVKTYSGIITFKSGMEVKKHSQTASFSTEWFYLNDIGNGIIAIEADGTDYKPETKYKVSPKATADWTEEYVGYDKDDAAYTIEASFKHTPYDIISYANADAAPFDFDAFETFAEKVFKEQTPSYKGIKVDHVEFTASGTTDGSKWTLKKGGKTISGADEFTASNIGSVTIDAAAGGTYDIPFEVYYDVKVSSTWTNDADEYYSGVIRVHTSLDGDIEYEVVAGGTVSFAAKDFRNVYGKNKTLESVTVNELPALGTLYHSGKTSNAYKVTEGKSYSATTSDDEVSKLIYKASASIDGAYSVYVPVTMDGSAGEKNVVVEIKVTEDIPFLDVAKNSTFYDYITYCYQHDIMGGKSATRFDAKSNISRIQLIVTMYRMAGSPSTYNNKTVPFTDVKGLNSEFTSALKWAYAKGIATGSGNKFNPNSAVTRQALVTILYRYAQSEGYDVDVMSTSNLGYYTDGGQVSSVMKEAMNWALENQLLSGSGNKLLPGNGTTRGAAAKILANFHATYVD